MRLSATDKDTICALITAHGIGAISLLRVSGPKAADILRKLAAFLPEKLESHKIYYGILKDLEGLPLDEVLVSYFQNGRSFTGETTFEISCHGSEAVVDEILRTLVAAGSRPAERGEFTYRAFMNGRLDLVQAESVLALIESRSKRASSLALRQLQGDLSKRLHKVRDDLTWIIANLEANIDFAAEDIEIAKNETLIERGRKVFAECDALLATYKKGRLLRDGFRMMLVGRPNVGKSSLLNALAGEDRAIVTPIAGTTRDFVEANLSLEGVRVTAVDSAGLRVTDDPVEKIGVERTLEKLADADLVALVLDAESGLEDEFFAQIPWEKTVVLTNKMDVTPDFRAPQRFSNNALKVLPVSAQSGFGLEDWRVWLSGRLRQDLSEDSTLLSNARHFRGLVEARKNLEEGLGLLQHNESPDLIALEFQAALGAVYDILGLTYDDQVMDRVFSEFCLGK